MTQYLLLIHGNATSQSTPEEWGRFFEAAQDSGMFKGGSELGSRTILGDIASLKSTDQVVAYMRFDAEDKEQLLDLLAQHPVLLRGGSAELCELVKS